MESKWPLVSIGPHPVTCRGWFDIVFASGALDFCQSVVMWLHRCASEMFGQILVLQVMPTAGNKTLFDTTIASINVLQYENFLDDTERYNPT